MSNLDVDIRLLPRLWLVRLPLHIPVYGRRVETHPPLEFVVGAHGGSADQVGDNKRSGSRIRIIQVYEWINENCLPSYIETGGLGEESTPMRSYLHLLNSVASNYYFGHLSAVIAVHGSMPIPDITINHSDCRQ